jgi:hypothetical protein
MVCGIKGCPRERYLRKIYTENNVGILETHYNILSFVSFLCCFCLHITEYEQIRGAQNFLGPRGVKYLNTGLPVPQEPVYYKRPSVVTALKNCRFKSTHFGFSYFRNS